MEAALFRSIAFLLLVASARCAAIAAEPEQPWLTVPAPPPMPVPDMSGRAPVNDIELYYAIFGKGRGNPVVLLHGGLGSSDFWSFEVPRLAKNHEVIVVDNRGHGRSTLSAQPLSYDLMESDVIALMDHLKLAKASIVGWSDGGVVGMVMAIKHRERLGKLVTYGANFSRAGEKERTGPPDPEAKARFAKYLAMAEANYRAVSPTPDGFAGLRRALGAMYANEPELKPADLRTIATPTLIVAGEYEQFYKREHFEELARLIPGAKLAILNNASHGGPNQQPDAFHKIVADFLDAP
jgi:pimeloyl-ACP methyl ester carboxylesterase